MNAVIQQTINELKMSADPRDRSQATQLEMLFGLEKKIDDHGEQLNRVEVQTTKTNGRVTRQEGVTKEIEKRITLIEEPIKQVRWAKHIVQSLLAGVVVLLGLLFALTSTPFWGEQEEVEKTIEKAVERALQER